MATKLNSKKANPSYGRGLSCTSHPSSTLSSPLTCMRARYIVLTTLQALYSYFIEGDIVFVGKRKTFDKRVRFSL